MFSTGTSKVKEAKFNRSLRTTNYLLGFLDYGLLSAFSSPVCSAVIFGAYVGIDTLDLRV